MQQKMLGSLVDGNFYTKVRIIASRQNKSISQLLRDATEAYVQNFEAKRALVKSKKQLLSEVFEDILEKMEDA